MDCCCNSVWLIKFVDDRKVRIGVMDVTLNKLFWDHAKVYQSKPVVAAKYQPGMENGWVVIYSYERAMGFKFFKEYREAKQYSEEKPTHMLITDHGLVEVKCFYDEPCGKESKKEFEDDEQGKYDVGFVGKDVFIIKDNGGSVRVWHNMGCESFFGKYGVYERDGEEYIKTDIVDVC